MGLIFHKKILKLVCIWGIIPWLLSMGTAIPILSSITNQIPGISMLTNPSRYFIFTILILSLLSGHGLDYIVDSSRYNRKYFSLFIVCLVLILVGIIIRPYSHGTSSIDIPFFITIAVFLISTTLYLFASQVDLFEKMIPFLETMDQYEIDELLCVMPVFAFAPMA